MTVSCNRNNFRVKPKVSKIIMFIRVGFSAVCVKLAVIRLDLFWPQRNNNFSLIL